MRWEWQCAEFAEKNGVVIISDPEQAVLITRPAITQVDYDTAVALHRKRETIEREIKTAGLELEALESQKAALEAEIASLRRKNLELHTEELLQRIQDEGGKKAASLLKSADSFADRAQAEWRGHYEQRVRQFWLFFGLLAGAWLIPLAIAGLNSAIGRSPYLLADEFLSDILFGTIALIPVAWVAHVLLRHLSKEKTKTRIESLRSNAQFETRYKL